MFNPPPISQFPSTFFDLWIKYPRHARSECPIWGKLVESEVNEASHLINKSRGSNTLRLISSNSIASNGEDNKDVQKIAKW